MTTTPPHVLSHGRHDTPRDGACMMEVASFIASEDWTDRPACVHPALARLARMANDACNDEQRDRLLLPLLPRLLDTATGDQGAMRAIFDADTRWTAACHEALGTTGRVVDPDTGAEIPRTVALLDFVLRAYETHAGREPRGFTWAEYTRVFDLTGMMLDPALIDDPAAATPPPGAAAAVKVAA